MQVTRMEERMAGNSRDINLAFQGAEAALRDGEARVEAMADAPVLCTSAPCPVWERNSILVDPRDELLAWWTTNGVEYGAAATREVTEVTRDPYVVAEHLAFIPDSLTDGGSEVKPGRDYYKVIANSAGASNTAVVVLESTYTTRRN
jgi:type IV pilus assembly protein PilX